MTISTSKICNKGTKLFRYATDSIIKKLINKNISEDEKKNYDIYCYPKEKPQICYILKKCNQRKKYLGWKRSTEVTKLIIQNLDPLQLFTLLLRNTGANTIIKEMSESTETYENQNIRFLSLLIGQPNSKNLMQMVKSEYLNNFTQELKEVKEVKENVQI